MNLQILFEEQTKLLNKINLEKKRYLYEKINWNLKPGLCNRKISI